MRRSHFEVRVLYCQSRGKRSSRTRRKSSSALVNLPDVLPFYQAALNQELLSNSANGFGIAVAHARLSGVKHLQFALGRAAPPVVWGTKGSWPVQLVFLLAVPATDAASYLHLLSSLARLGGNHEILAELLVASDTSGMLAILSKIKLQ